MASHFHSLRIKAIQQETADCISIAFDVPRELQESFAFTQGQHLTLRATINGEEQRRNYSLCSSPLEGEWRIAIKKVEQGLFSHYAHEQLQQGQYIDVMPPMGKFFTTLQPSQAKHYVFVAAGSGITPVISQIKTILLVEPMSRVTLLYANRHRNSIIFKEELEGLKNKFITRFNLVHILSREKTDAPLLHGRIDAAKCRLLFNGFIPVATIDECFICGPEAMIHTVKDYLHQAGLPLPRIHFELFTTAAQYQPLASSTADFPVSDADPKATIVIKLDGIESSFELNYHGINILDAALQQGADLPYACKGGVCCTCKARLVEGEVRMDVNYGLEIDEIKAGYVLTCQSHPLTPFIKIDYDG